MTLERLHKILARAGVASRRESERLIAAGRVLVDGRVVTQPGTQADPDTQEIKVDGKPIGKPEGHQYWMVHKPPGVVCTASDPEGRPIVLDILPTDAGERLYPVGRLDMYSEGLVLLTNDGELALQLTHPRYQVPKYYRVWVEGKPSPEAIAHLRQGVNIEGGLSAPAQVHMKTSDGHMSKLRMVLSEGRKREIRQMCRAVGHPVKRLVRVGLGSLRLGDLAPGQSRRLTPRELEDLRRSIKPFSGCKPPDHGVPNTARKHSKHKGR